MKKIYLISVITIILGFIFTLKPDWFTFFWGWQILLLPLTAGILMVLVQNEHKSYCFLPKLIIGWQVPQILDTFSLSSYNENI